MEFTCNVATNMKSLAYQSSTIKSGIIFSNKSFIIEKSVQEVHQEKSRLFYISISSSFPLVSSKESSFSSTRSLRLLMQEDEITKSQYWELWSSVRLLKVKSLKSIHNYFGHVSAFGKPRWSDNDKYVSYIAEPINPSSSSFWSSEENPGKKFIFKDDFGECMRNITNPSLYLYDIDLNDIKIINVSPCIWPAQPVFRPGTNDIYYIGFEKGEFKLALSGMINRKSKLFKTDIFNKEFEEIDTGKNYMAVLFPKFSPNGNLLSFYGVPQNSISHNMCISLCVYKIASKEIIGIVPRIHEFNENFNGIYGYHETLETYDWIDNNTIIFTTNHNASECLFITDLERNLKEITFPLQKPYSLSILDIFNQTTLLKCSNFSTPDQLFTISSESFQLPVQLTTPDFTEPSSQDNPIQFHINSFETTVISSSSSPVKHILHHKQGNKLLVALIHGGPHSSALSSFNLFTSLLALHNFSLILINYPGSVGFGQITIEALLGHVGQLDVQSCVEAIESAKALTGCDKVVAYGKSHGGFIACHLGYLMNLEGIMLVNGVYDLTSMISSTDIVDWGFAEVFNSQVLLPASVEQVVKAFGLSPISFAHRIKCPVFMAVGKLDTCAVSGISLGFKKILESSGIKCDVVVYESQGHDIAGTADFCDLAVKSVNWILERMET